MTGALIRRQLVPAGLRYQQYREPLRTDFVWACAYCSIAELEASGIAFQIDHYIPQAAQGTDAYANLYYSCDRCNLSKLDWTAPPDHKSGNYFIRIDHEDPRDHLRPHPTDEGLIDPFTPTGVFNEQMLDLNRQALQRLRKQRARFQRSSEQTTHGLRILARLRIDQLPKDLRAQVMTQRSAVVRHARDIDAETLRVLDNLCRSALIDPDPGRRERKRRLKAFRAQLPPAVYSARRPKKNRGA